MAEAKKDAKKKPIYESQESLYQKAVRKMQADRLIVQYAYKIDNYKLAAAMFDEVGDYMDAPALAKKCRELAEAAGKEEREALYQKAQRQIGEGVLEDEDKCKKLCTLLEGIGDYKDAPELLKKAQDSIANLQKKGKRKRYGIVGALAGVVVLAAVLFFSGIIRYAIGFGYLKTGHYAEAQATLEPMGKYLKAHEYAREARYSRLLKAKKDSVVSFGNYHWKILKKQNDVVTMIASDITEKSDFYKVPFDEDGKGTSWEDSSLRAWLNGEVYQNGFDDFERSCILARVSEPTVNETYETSWDEETEDYLTLLSVEEASEYAKALATLGLNFWVRTPGAHKGTAVFISADHVLRDYGYPMTDADTAVRPVISVDLGALRESLSKED